MVKVGIIGCGKIAQTRHIPEYATNPGAELGGFYDANLLRAQALAGQYGGKAFESYEDLLNDDTIEAVSILTPNFLHAENTIAALEKGKHVLCEKPMATTLEACEAMVEAARVSGKKLMIGQNQRFTSAHKKAKELLQAGAIGEVISFSSVFAHSGPDNWSIDGSNSWFMDKARSQFGALADLGIHKTDLLVYLLGQKIVKAAAYVGTLHKQVDGAAINVDDNAICTYITEGGAMGTMTASWTNYGAEINTTSLFGTKGAMHLYRAAGPAVVVERAGQPDECYDMGAIQTNANQTASGVIDAFVDCIVNDTAVPVSAEDVLPSMKAVFACVESSRQGGCLIDI